MIQLPTPRPRGKNSFSINSTLNSSTAVLELRDNGLRCTLSVTVQRQATGDPQICPWRVLRPVTTFLHPSDDHNHRFVARAPAGTVSSHMPLSSTDVFMKVLVFASIPVSLSRCVTVTWMNG
jgi:hypothetical protein